MGHYPAMPVPMAKTGLRQSERTQRSQDMILAGAQKVFLAHGYGGASLKAIAAESGVTQSLIHHHFESKEKLWAAVRDRCFERMFAELRPLLTDATRGSDFAVDFLRAYFNYLEKNPSFVRLLSWLNAEGLEPPPFAAGKGSPLIPAIKREQDAGRLRDDLAPELIMSLLWMSCEAWFFGKRQYAHRFNHPGVANVLTDEQMKGIVLSVIGPALRPH